MQKTAGKNQKRTNVANPDDGEGVIVAGPDARARANGERRDERQSPIGEKSEKTDRPTRDTHETPAANPKTSTGRK